MRTEKYNQEDWGDDIRYAFYDNKLGHELKNIDVIVAEVCGENDGYSWYWILQMKDGRFGWAEGSCDYTGWECSSQCTFKGGFKTPKMAIEMLVLYEYESRKNIKDVLLKQIKGELPFAVYQE